MRPLLVSLGLLLWLQGAAAAGPPGPSSQQPLPDGQRLLVLCYHDVVPSPGAGTDPETVATATLAAHLNWLRSEGYQPIGLDALAGAFAGTVRLPERPVLLTFDDGYLSLYTQVFPLLRAFRAPAVAALVGQWMETPAGQTVRYSDRGRPRDQFITWEQAREMQDSGLVEFASHTWDLHRGIAGNPAGSLEPAATTHAFLGLAGYESDAAWSQRVHDDLERNSALLAQRLGRRPRAIVWPYGRYSDPTESIARELGMTIGLTLDSGRRERAVSMGRVRRLLVDGNPPATRFARLVREQDGAPTVRFVQLDLQGMAGAAALDLEPHIDELLERIRQLGIETVVLPAFAPPGASGRIEAVYFPNRTLPVRADLLNRLAWAIATRTQARAYAWLPSDGFALDPLADDPAGQRRIGDLFEDLGKSVYLQGLLVGSGSPGGASEAIAARSALLAGRTRAWQPQLMTALKLDGGALPPTDRIAALLELYDYLQIDAGPDARPPADWLAPIRSLPGGPAHALIGLPAAGAEARSQALQQAGFANFGVVGADLADVATLRRTLSLRSQPAQAAQAGGR